jgi:formamidopyrimidine-DNA glycosylase
MSIELPEAQILAEQTNKELRGKHIKSYRLQDCESLQRLGFINKDAKSFDQLVDGKIKVITSRGSVIRIQLDNGINLILAPEYGGRILYHTNEKTIPAKLHLRIDFSDNTLLTVRLTGMGVIHVMKDDELKQSYVYRRDFSHVLSPTDDEKFTFDRFSRLLDAKNIALKSALVGKDAIVVGLGNSAFQDIVYRAKIHPKRKTSELDKNEKQILYDAMRLVLQDRIRHGGKKEFLDVYGNQGDYTPAMGPNMKQQICPACGTPIEKLSIGGGHTYFCPKCQK